MATKPIVVAPTHSSFAGGGANVVNDSTAELALKPAPVPEQSCYRNNPGEHIHHNR